MDKIEMWKEVCCLPKTKLGIVLWLHLPRDSTSDIKESINTCVGVTELKKETGVKKFNDTMNEAFKPLDMICKLEIYINYYIDMKK